MAQAASASLFCVLRDWISLGGPRCTIEVSVDFTNVLAYVHPVLPSCSAFVHGPVLRESTSPVPSFWKRCAIENIHRASLVVYAIVLALRKLRQEDPKFKVTLSSNSSNKMLICALVGEPKPGKQAATETIN